MSGQQLGMYLLDAAKEAGVTTLSGRVSAVDTSGGAVSNVTVTGADGRDWRSHLGHSRSVFVNAA